MIVLPAELEHDGVRELKPIYSTLRCVCVLVVCCAVPVSAQQTNFFTDVLKGLGFSQEPQVSITDATNLIDAKDYEGALRVALSLIEQRNYNDAMQIAKQLVPLKQLAAAVQITTRLMALNPRPDQAVIYDGYGEFLNISNLLIKEQDYNDALVILAGVIRRPDYLDDAQVLINKVRDLRNQYNAYGDQMLQALKAGDAETAKAVIAKMESVDKNPNDKTLVQIKLAKRSVNKIVFEKAVNAIMDEAAVLLKNREYGNAVLKYLEAEPVAKAEFLENQYGNITEGLVARTWDDLKGATAAYVGQEVPLKTLAATGQRLLSGTGRALDPVLSSLTDPWRAFFGWRKRVWRDTVQFQTQANLILKSRNQDDFYLTYALWLNQGRPTAKSPEGILFALDQLWTETLTPWSAQIRTSIEAQYTVAKKAFDAGQYDSAKTSFDDLRLYTGASLDLLALNNLQGYVLEDGSLEKGYLLRLRDTIPLATWIESRLVLARQGAQASVDLKALALTASDATLNRAGLEAARAAVRTMREAFIANAEKTASTQRREAGLTQDGWKPLDPTTFLAGWLTSWNQFRQKAALQEAAFVDRRGKLDFDLLDGRNRQLTAALTAAQSQIVGIPDPPVQGQTPVTRKYPLQASQGLDALRPLQDALQNDITDFIALYDRETPDVKTAAVLAWPPRGQTLLRTLIGNQGLQTQLVASAKASYAQSQAIRKQGQDLVALITSSINAENFPQAKTQLDNMSALYNQSLSLQEDPAFRKAADDENTRLQVLYNDGFKRLVVKDVRKYITDGSQAFFDGLFPQAEQILTKAKSRWAEANVDANQEITYWLNLSQQAQGAGNTRAVGLADPLYNEVEQLLNFARRDYNDAQALKKAGKTAEADDLFDRASAVLSKILLIFPSNQEMGLLKLQIEKDKNPEGFPELFKTKLNAAKKLIATNPPLAYTDLQDLDRIKPGDTDVADAIKQVRITLGLDIKAIDPTKKAQADRLYEGAKAAYDSGNQTRFAQASRDVDTGLALIQAYPRDPTYRKLAVLKDSLAQATPTVVTFTLTMNQEWNDILTATAEGSYKVARALLDAFKSKYPTTVRDSRIVGQDNKINNGLSR